MITFSYFCLTTVCLRLGCAEGSHGFAKLYNRHNALVSGGLKLS